MLGPPDGAAISVAGLASQARARLWLGASSRGGHKQWLGLRQGGAMPVAGPPAGWPQAVAGPPAGWPQAVAGPPAGAVTRRVLAGAVLGARQVLRRAFGLRPSATPRQDQLVPWGRLRRRPVRSRRVRQGLRRAPAASPPPRLATYPTGSPWGSYGPPEGPEQARGVYAVGPNEPVGTVRASGGPSAELRAFTP